MKQHCLAGYEGLSRDVSGATRCRKWRHYALVLAIWAGLWAWGGPVPAQGSDGPGLMRMASVNSAGIQGNKDSGLGGRSVAVSADGRFVAFQSWATNLVAGDTNEAHDIFVHDRQTGMTERVSVNSDGTEDNPYSGQPAISADGRFVAYESHATILVAGDTYERMQVVVHDRETGVTECVSVGSDGKPADQHSYLPSVSADGRFVAFQSSIRYLQHWVSDVFVRDRQTGVTECVSVGIDHGPYIGYSGRPTVSADGRIVAFESYAENAALGDPYGTKRIFVHDRETGVTECASVASDGRQSDYDCLSPAMSADGRSLPSRPQPGTLSMKTKDTVDGISTFMTARRE